MMKNKSEKSSKNGVENDDNSEEESVWGIVLCQQEWVSSDREYMGANVEPCVKGSPPVEANQWLK